MAVVTLTQHPGGIAHLRSRIYRSVFFMTGAALFVSTALILSFNSAVFKSGAVRLLSASELAAYSLMPYMISAIIAAITAIGVMTILPSARGIGASERIVGRLRSLAAGDLSGTLRIKGDDQHREIAAELNNSVSLVCTRVTQLKVINRQQWGILCQIRATAEQNGQPAIVRLVEEMEGNWKRLAEVESALVTG